MGFLRTAHSHEDVDQVFGQIVRLIMGKAFSTPNDLIDLINTSAGRSLGTHSDTRIQGSSAEAYKLDQVTAWKAFVQQTGVAISGLRRTHYLRICLRADIGANTLDNVFEVEDFRPGRGIQQHPNDIFLVTKRWLHDVEIQRVIALIPAQTASKIRVGAAPPCGLADRRTISSTVSANIAKHVPICRRHGELSAEAARYLLGWSSGTLEQQPKPATYSIFDYRFDPDMQTEVRQPGLWTRPHRQTRIDIRLDRLQEGDEDSGEESGDDDGAVVLPGELRGE